jgi:hypothetical protein
VRLPGEKYPAKFAFGTPYQEMITALAEENEQL